MAKRIAQPDIRPIGENRYRLEEDYVYEWEENRVRFRITVPAGFEHDGASIPRLLWTLTSLRPDGLIRAAALVHDFIYRHKGRMPADAFETRTVRGGWTPSFMRISRTRADMLFRKLMGDAGIDSHLTWIAWSGVRSGGWLAWMTNKPKPQPEGSAS